ncbi:hypothetical protein J2W56_000888 [Nocardia kruczakiae]|uniref:Uncharacterized protein n=1 Tax=Nocardia kruczakiae TaxID=261477 RepID=A0ABU1X9F5_9NOCA|nr:hypothetical protein [Nocardia kruczakiae]MDR7167170.1 hypothetical protein [Nocardia kruczakiae]
MTGVDARDCLSMVATRFPDGVPPTVHRITVDISLAEPLPVNPRFLGVTAWRGVWYPPANLATGPTRDIDRRGAPAVYPAPVTASRGRARAGETPHKTFTWWDEIPHINGLRWALVDMHCAEHRDGRRQIASALRDACAADPTLGLLVRDALDYMIAWRPTPEEWFDPTGIRFAEQEALGEYLRAFRDYLLGDRAEPIFPPEPETLPSGAIP